MAQRIVETVIGRLITDEQFRTAFLADPLGTLDELLDRGLELTPTEVAALVNTDSALWERAADTIDPRLQKASLLDQSTSPADGARPSISDSPICSAAR